jgi:hypothetical protein
MSNKIMLTQLGLNRTRFTAPQLAALPDEVLLRAAKLKDVTVTATQPYDDTTKREIADAVLAAKGALGRPPKPVTDADYRQWDVGKGGFLSETGTQYLDTVDSRCQPLTAAERALIDLPLEEGLVPWVPADSLKKEGSRLSSGFSGASGRGG